MSTYFILSKPASEPVDSDAKNRIIGPFLGHTPNDSEEDAKSDGRRPVEFGRDAGTKCRSSDDNTQDVYLLPSTNIDYYRHRGLFEKGLIEWSKQLCDPNWVMLDIGAHTGTYGIALANHCQHVYAFEPQKSTYYALCGSVALSNKTDKITCINVALGSELQSKRENPTLKVRSADGGGSSMFHISSATNTPIDAIDSDSSPDKTTTQTLCEENICVTTLDAMKIQNIGFIKLDVEYNELAVLQGGKRTIHQNLPKILFEVNPEETAANKQALIDFLTQEFNYKITALSNTNNMYLAHM
jgi:FkbM family methyltransferase